MIKVQITGEPKGHGKFLWTVEGTPLCGLSRQPLLDACRVVSRLGAQDEATIGLYRGDKLSMTCQVGYGRRVTIREKSTGLRPVPWTPYSGFGR